LKVRNIILILWVCWAYVKQLRQIS
jgi:hypothetical protein